MCGIAGYLERHAAARREVVDRQLAQVHHRGPDAWGVFAVGRAAIGQNRLSVIDLETGDPPITNEDGTIGVAFNGEIYNFRGRRRRELEAAGHRFATSGDTEVLAHLAEDRSAVAVARAISGMAAFAIWDSRREVLTLGRDRLGKKPLYYWSDSKRFVFGSEIKAVLAHPDVPKDIDFGVIPDYLTFGYVPTPRTFFSGVRSLAPGHVLTLGADMEPTTECYWEPPLSRGGAERDPITLDDAAREVRFRLRTAVERRLVADVPLGAFLSGGIDSSAIVAMMAGLSSRPVKTFTIGFNAGGGFDERPHAALVAERFGTEHTEFVVEPHAIDLIDRLVSHYDQPFGDSSAIPTYLLSELTRQHVTVALAGDGGDECFGGYERFAAGLAVGKAQRVPGATAGLSALSRLLPRVGQRALPVRAGRFAGRAALGLPGAFRSWIEMVPAEVRAELIGTEAADAIDDYQRIWDTSAGAPTLDRVLDLNLRTYLLDDLLPKVDRMAMAHALEVRSPFLDHELVEFALSLPPRTKVRGLSLKRALKRAMRGVLPDEIIDRRKHGFGVPLDAWFRGSLATYVSSMLGSPAARVRQHLRADGVDHLLAEHAAAHRDHGHALWALLTLEVFLRAQE